MVLRCPHAELECKGNLINLDVTLQARASQTEQEGCEGASQGW